VTKRVENVVVIAVEAPSKCGSCKQERETRPYGPNGMRFCFKCGMQPKYRKTVEATVRKLFGG
jgi:hypothetical protein